MFKLKDISIRNKLVLMLVFTSVLVLVVFFTVFIISDVRIYRQRKVNTMLSMAQVIGDNSVAPIQFGDNEAAKDILSGLQEVSPELIHAVILDKKGKTFASYSKPGAGPLNIPPSMAGRQSLFTGENLFVSYDIINENEFLGKVVFETGLQELAELKRSKFEVAAMLFIIALGFSFLIAIAIQTYISKRLLYLVENFKEISRTGDYNKTITDDGKDEISVLISGFNDLLKQIKENQQRKDEFISIASHELKTPLTSIKGYLELLSDIEDKEPNKQFVQKVSENTKKLEKLIKDLLDASKIQGGKLEFTKVDFNMDELLDETIAAIQMVTVTHTIVKANSINETVYADRQRIEQVLTNLLSNAVKYSPGGKKVIVSAEKNDSALIVKIKDFGVGVPKGEMANIFERFYRAKDSSLTITGFGLGLYICRDIIQRHGGRIGVESEGKGSVFYFSLPLRNKIVNNQQAVTGNSL